MSGLLAFVLVALGGGVGAAARFWVAGAVSTRHEPPLPWGTVTVNVLGSFLIGVVSGLVLHAGADGGLEGWRLFLATGLCGGFTTFSTATVESVELARHGHVGRALVNAVGTLLATVTAVAAGIGTVFLLARGS